MFCEHRIIITTNYINSSGSWDRIAYFFGETNGLVFSPFAWVDIRLEFDRCRLEEDFCDDEPILDIILFENKII